MFDLNNPADVAELKLEIDTDPLSIGYDPANGDTGELLGLINAKNYTVSKPKISSALVRSETTYDAYDTLAIDEQEWLRWISGSNGFDEENMVVTTDLRTQLTGPDDASIWAVAHRVAMNQAMTDLIDVLGGRAEVLWGYGTTISRTDWFAARDS